MLSRLVVLVTRSLGSLSEGVGRLAVVRAAPLKRSYRLASVLLPLQREVPFRDAKTKPRGLPVPKFEPGDELGRGTLALMQPFASLGGLSVASYLALEASGSVLLDVLRRTRIHVDVAQDLVLVQSELVSAQTRLHVAQDRISELEERFNELVVFIEMQKDVIADLRRH